MGWCRWLLWWWGGGGEGVCTCSMVVTYVWMDVSPSTKMTTLCCLKTRPTRTAIHLRWWSRSVTSLPARRTRRSEGWPEQGSGRQFSDWSLEYLAEVGVQVNQNIMLWMNVHRCIMRKSCHWLSGVLTRGAMLVCFSPVINRIKHFCSWLFPSFWFYNQKSFGGLECLFLLLLK